MKKISLVLALLLGSLTSTLACDRHGSGGIVEDNNMWIPVSASKEALTMSEERFNAIIDKVEAIYSPIIAERGKTLEVIRKWEDGTVNAYAQQSGNIWKVSMFGGLARHETITEDAFATVVCHEVGHHIGGQPKKNSWWGSSWASNEGQADYFGTSKCLRKYMETDDNVAMMSEVEVPEFVTKQCKSAFANAEDMAMCQRGALAGLSLGNLFRALRKLETELKFDTPDPNVVTKTNHNHPEPQCRLDTYFAGSLCDKDHYADVSDSDANVNVCVRTEGYTLQARPQCWYAASSAE